MSPSIIIAGSTTPLALAALAIVAFTVMFRLIAKRLTSAASKLVVHWGFILALVFGALANISYFLDMYLNRVDYVNGTVVDINTEEPISGASVMIAGAAPVVSNKSGMFALTIPNSLKTDVYDISASAPDYEVGRFKVSGTNMKKSFRAALVRTNINFNEAIKKPENVSVGHFLGMPQLFAILTFHNPSHSKLVFDITVAVKSPEGSLIDLSVQGTYLVPPGNYWEEQMNVQLSRLEIESGQIFKTGFRYIRLSTRYLDLLSKAKKEYPSFESPRPTDEIYSRKLANEFTEMMNREMIWSAGEWTLIIKIQTLEGIYSKEFKFKLVPQEIERMKSVSRYYRTGYSTRPETPWAKDGSSVIPVNLL